MLFKASNGELSEKQLRKYLVKIENSVNRELKPSKIEMVFISYKASMSDAIESIYLAAKADPDCNALWLPVPYVEFNSDRTVSRTMYEGQEHYPSYIECTDWNKYDVKKQHPDVIFTFNPYDGGNVVTSIHSDFYCERLRNFTDMLVYVPYFCVGEDYDMRKFKHLATTAGCVFSHKVIVESRPVRNAYVEGFKNAYGSQLGNASDKFVALGSAKLEKVLSVKKESCLLPEAWRHLVYGKKVILYNTGISGILRYNSDEYFKKIRSVIEVFQKRDDVALWWRPHPLSESTFESMRPQYATEYKKIVNGYRSMNTSIFDDSADLHRAIAMSDIYYGDGSSVVPLYKATGKPMIYQNIKDLECNRLNELIDGLHSNLAERIDVNECEPIGKKIYDFAKAGLVK
jgi:hypothetical protein